MFEIYENKLEDLKTASHFRSISKFERKEGKYIYIDGKVNRIFSFIQ